MDDSEGDEVEDEIEDEVEVRDEFETVTSVVSRMKYSERLESEVIRELGIVRSIESRSSWYRSRAGVDRRL
jgi:hypothetical protein